MMKARFAFSSVYFCGVFRRCHESRRIYLRGRRLRRHEPAKQHGAVRRGARSLGVHGVDELAEKRPQCRRGGRKSLRIR